MKPMMSQKQMGAMAQKMARRGMMAGMKYGGKKGK